MIRIDFFIRPDQKKELDKFPGNTSEHIRRALDDYIIKHQVKNQASVSPSHCNDCFAKAGWPHASECKAVKVVYG